MTFLPIRGPSGRQSRQSVNLIAELRGGFIQGLIKIRASKIRPVRIPDRGFGDTLQGRKTKPLGIKIFKVLYFVRLQAVLAFRKVSLVPFKNIIDTFASGLKTHRALIYLLRFVRTIRIAHGSQVVIFFIELFENLVLVI